MALLVAKPPEHAAPLPDSPGTGQTLLLSTTGFAKHVIFKVKWDPAKHPKDWQGKFVETPDKVKAGNSLVGDTVVTKSGKVFYVEKQTPKGVKVNPVNPDSGEVQATYTVLGNEVEVAPVEKAKVVGSQHPIGELDPGTYVQHPKSGKRFLLSKQGKWATVYPVDDNGDVVSKHTVLPPQIVVEVVPKEVTDVVTPQTVDQVAEVAQSLGQLTEEDVFADPTLRGLFHEELAKLWTNGEPAFMADVLPDIQDTENKDDWVRLLHDFYSGGGGNPETDYHLWDEALEVVVNAQQTKLTPGQQLTAATVELTAAERRELLEFAYTDWLAQSDFGGSAEMTAQAVEDVVSEHFYKGSPKDPTTVYGWVQAHKISYPGGSDLQVEDYLWERLAQAEAKKVAAEAPSVPTQVQEVLPSKLPKVPRKYEPGVGKDTKLVIEHDEVTGINVRRVRPGLEGSGALVDSATSLTQARRLARSHSGRHEQIEEVKITRSTWEENQTRLLVYDLKPGQLVMTGEHGKVYEFVETFRNPPPSWNPTSEGHLIVKLRTPKGQDFEHPARLPLVSLSHEADDTFLNAVTTEFQQSKFGSTSDVRIETETARALSERAGVLRRTEPKQLRAAKPNLFIPELQADWSLDEVVGTHWSDAHKHLTKLGWREIKPRQKEFVRYINANGNRLTVTRNKQGVIQEVNQGGGEFVLQNLGTAKDLYGQLQEVLDTGGDLTSLDPRASQLAVARTSYVQNLLYDLAVGKQNNVAAVLGKDTKVKSDDAYLKELQEELWPGYDLSTYLAEAEQPFVKLKARGSIIEQFGWQQSEDWDYPNRLLTVPEEFESDSRQLAALHAIVQRQGVANHILHTTTNLSDEEASTVVFSDKLAAGSPALGAKRLALEWEAHEEGLPSAFDDLDEHSRDWVLARLTESLPNANDALEIQREEHESRAKNLRAQALQDEVAKRRKAEGTVEAATAVFDLPTWDEVEFKPQTLEEVESLVASIQPHGELGALTDVSAFYNGGYAKDGVVYYQSGRADLGVELEHDAVLTERLLQAGAERGTNRHPIDPGYDGASSMYDGESLVLEFGEGSQELDLLNAPDGYWASGARERLYAVGITSVTEITAIHEVLKLAEDKGGGYPGLHKYLIDRYGPEQGEAKWRKIRYKQTSMVEYVPHQQPPGNSGGAPTSQRGRLTVYGLTPEQAQTELRKLGVVGDLEPEVPFRAVMGSDRRFGPVAPAHPAYLRGEAPMPKTPARVTHGLTGGANVDQLKTILEGGGLLSIQQRHRAGILSKQHTTSSAGDIRSGIDHAVFGTIGVGGTCGGGSPYKFVMKPSVFLRRDIVLSDQDFGSAPTRYPSYKAYLNKLQKVAAQGTVSVGDRVRLTDDYYSGKEGTVTKINEVTGSVSVDLDDGSSFVATPSEVKALIQFEPGDEVAITTGAYAGKTGTVIGMDETASNVVHVKFEDAETAINTDFVRYAATQEVQQNTNLYVPVDPVVRQQHFDTVKAGSSNEFNMAPHVPVEDMEYVAVPGDKVSEVNELLDQMLADGRIAARPQVVDSGTSTLMSDLAGAKT